MVDDVSEETGVEDVGRADPSSGSGEVRAAGLGPLDINLQEALGVKKFDALMSGLVASYRKGYSLLLYEWARFCDSGIRAIGSILLRNYGGQLIGTPCGWGGVTRLSDSSRSRYLPAIRFHHLIRGYPDFTKIGNRHRMTPESARRPMRIAENPRTVRTCDDLCAGAKSISLEAQYTNRNYCMLWRSGFPFSSSR